MQPDEVWRGPRPCVGTRTRYVGTRKRKGVERVTGSPDPPNRTREGRRHGTPGRTSVNSCVGCTIMSVWLPHTLEKNMVWPTRRQSRHTPQMPNSTCTIGGGRARCGVVVRSHSAAAAEEARGSGDRGATLKRTLPLIELRHRLLKCCIANPFELGL